LAIRQGAFETFDRVGMHAQQFLFLSMFRGLEARSMSEAAPHWTAAPPPDKSTQRRLTQLLHSLSIQVSTGVGEDRQGNKRIHGLALKDPSDYRDD
jgi:hypothetical protein